MPRPLLLVLLLAGGLLTVDTVVWFVVAEDAWDYLVVGINLSVIGLIALVHLRRPAIARTLRVFALIWSLVALLAYFAPDFSDAFTSYTTVEWMLEFPVFLALYIVLRKQSVRSYLGEGGQVTHASRV